MPIAFRNTAARESEHDAAAYCRRITFIARCPRSGRRSDIVIENGRISDIVPTQTTVADARRIDAADRVVIPGLVNAHTHGQGNCPKV